MKDIQDRFLIAANGDTELALLYDRAASLRSDIEAATWQFETELEEIEGKIAARKRELSSEKTTQKSK